MKKFFYYSILLLSLFACQKEDESGHDHSQSDIPLIKINTNGNTIVNEPKVNATLEVHQKTGIEFSVPIGIEYRGKFSYIVFPKKSYGFEMRNESSQEVSAAILGLPGDEDWILYAAANDFTLCRNVLIYQLSNEINRYAARTKWVELEVNNEYRGAYVLMEKIKRGSNRINITKLLDIDNTEPAITGGYILKIDKTDGDDWGDHMVYTEDISFRSNYSVTGQVLNYDPYGSKQGEETYFLYDSPKASNITSQQKEYIKNYVNAFEAALLAETFIGETRTYPDYIDVNSFVDYFILNELSANPDAYRLSTFLYKNRGGKLTIGPVWDFDFAFGNDSRSIEQGWIYQFNTSNPWDGWLVQFWWPKLMEDPLFKQAIKTRWTALRGTKLKDQYIYSIIDGYAEELTSNGVVARNFTKWEEFDVEPTTTKLNTAYQTEIDEMKDWINGRLAWMDQQIGSF